MTRRRVYRQSRRLVHDNDVAILIDDGQWYCFCEQLETLGRRNRERDLRILRDLFRGLAEPSVYGHQSFVNQAADVAARQLGTAPRDEDIQPFAAAVGGKLNRPHAVQDSLSATGTSSRE